MDQVAQHVAAMTVLTLKKPSLAPRIIMFGDKPPENADQYLGVIPLQLNGFYHFLVAAILGYEFCIGVYGGCFVLIPATYFF